MKILFVVHGYPPENVAGTEVYTFNLVREFSKKHSIFVFHRSQVAAGKEYVIAKRVQNGATVYSIKNTFNACLSFEYTYNNHLIDECFGRLLDEIRPDIVHFQHLLYLSAGMVKEAKKRELPVVFTLNDYWLFCPQGQLFRNNKDICGGKTIDQCIKCIPYQLSLFKNLVSAYSITRRFFPPAIFRLIKNIYLCFTKILYLTDRKARYMLLRRKDFLSQIREDIDVYISPSKFMKEVSLTFGLSSDKIRVCGYGFAARNFTVISKESQGRLCFGFIGNLMPAKGPHVLIKSFNRIKSPRAELKVYGSTASYKGSLLDYGRNLRSLAKNENIKFMGEFSNERVQEIMKGIDVLVVPSIWGENSPLVIQEAFLSGIPVIASRIGGIRELIDDGANGLLFNPNDDNDLLDKMSYLINNPDVVERLKTRIPRVKTIEDNVLELETLYGGLLKRTVCEGVN
jgi:glycosyltransferase involved in cell wall biosynthesis